MSALRIVSLLLQGVFFIAVGVSHFTNPGPFIGIVPAFLPAPAALVAISGVAEIAGGVGLLVPPLRTWAGWGLIALLIAVFPANINMAVNKLPFGGKVMPEWALWLRLPLQPALMAWIWWAALRSSN